MYRLARQKWVFVMIFVLKADTTHIDRGCVGEFDVPRYRILARPEVVGSYILRSVRLVLSLVPVRPRDAIVRLRNRVDVILAVSPREGLEGRRQYDHGDGLPIDGSQPGWEL